MTMKDAERRQTAMTAMSYMIMTKDIPKDTAMAKDISDGKESSCSSALPYSSPPWLQATLATTMLPTPAMPTKPIQYIPMKAMYIPKHVTTVILNTLPVILNTPLVILNEVKDLSPSTSSAKTG